MQTNQPQTHAEWCAALDGLVVEAGENLWEMGHEKDAWEDVEEYRTVQRANSSISNAALALRDVLIMRERVSIMLADKEDA